MRALWSMTPGTDAAHGMLVVVMVVMMMMMR